ncbi:unnamed protein product [Rotaria magnacalcarata]|uniref:Replication termination factor 2 n=2 Tax=Rotaria magnacalcarata TaxID=392030 RepID=A0A814XXS5_9BILA|nr:unnamed protein product [Rotaria magnacalcarata]CAF1222210.1 unnamed protein product [Rotaria magnacalcarata]CAF1915113.1 unnamed protein product [Rotaria magnacalcarata]CAF3997295.1 unnamed protein product [Rotaria magnacalcarata]CAF4023747.1 unnamed protein product [Rotaria magnacalcarata]
MGCDGGTIPKRDELVRQKKKAEVKDKNAANMAKWRYCTLKYDALKRPIVVDSHGLLYNKDAILEFLLDRMQFEHGPSYVKKMKDVRELQLTESPEFKSNHNDLGNEYLDVYSSPFICPLTGLEMNGKYKFCAIWTCGCVLSERALRSINNNSNEKLCCPKCGKEYASNDDVIILNPENEDLALMEQRRQRLNASQKKNGSTKRKTTEIEEESNGKKTKIESTANSNGASSSPAAANSSVSSSTTNKNASTSNTNTSKLVVGQKSVSDKTKIQQDPTTSHLYKSLFTTSEAAKEKEKNKAHWVTYNPLYF